MTQYFSNLFGRGTTTTSSANPRVAAATKEHKKKSTGQSSLPVSDNKEIENFDSPEYGLDDVFRRMPLLVEKMPATFYTSVGFSAATVGKDVLKKASLFGNFRKQTTAAQEAFVREVFVRLRDVIEANPKAVLHSEVEQKRLAASTKLRKKQSKQAFEDTLRSPAKKRKLAKETACASEEPDGKASGSLVETKTSDPGEDQEMSGGDGSSAAKSLCVDELECPDCDEDPEGFLSWQTDLIRKLKQTNLRLASDNQQLRERNRLLEAENTALKATAAVAI